MAEIRRPKIATCTASVFVNAVATENDRSRMAASNSAVPKICATAPAAVKARNVGLDAGAADPLTAQTMQERAARTETHRESEPASPRSCRAKRSNCSASRCAPFAPTRPPTSRRSRASCETGRLKRRAVLFRISAAAAIAPGQELHVDIGYSPQSSLSPSRRSGLRRRASTCSEGNDRLATPP